MCSHCGKSEKCRQMRVGKMLVWVCVKGNCGKKWLAKHTEAV